MKLSSAASCIILLLACYWRHSGLCLLLPQDRNIQSSTEWRQQLGEVDKSILEYMRSSIKGGFDEERHGSRIGFANLKR
jgi:hypothetical protein